MRRVPSWRAWCGAATQAFGRTVGCTIDAAPKWPVGYAQETTSGSQLDQRTRRQAEIHLPRPTSARSSAHNLPAAGRPTPVRLIVRALGDVDVQYVGRFLRAQIESPNLPPKSTLFVGIYMAPPENAIVIFVSNVRALTDHSHAYKQHGTSTLFAVFVRNRWQLSLGFRTLASNFARGPRNQRQNAKIFGVERQ